MSTDEVFTIAPLSMTVNGGYFATAVISGDGRHVAYTYRWRGGADNIGMVMHYIGDWVDSLPDP